MHHGSNSQEAFTQRGDHSVASVQTATLDLEVQWRTNIYIRFSSCFLSSKTETDAGQIFLNKTEMKLNKTSFFYMAFSSHSA